MSTHWIIRVVEVSGSGESKDVATAIAETEKPEPPWNSVGHALEELGIHAPTDLNGSRHEIAIDCTILRGDAPSEELGVFTSAENTKYWLTRIFTDS